MHFLYVVAFFYNAPVNFKPQPRHLPTPWGSWHCGWNFSNFGNSCFSRHWIPLATVWCYNSAILSQNVVSNPLLRPGDVVGDLTVDLAPGHLMTRFVKSHPPRGGQWGMGYEIDKCIAHWSLVLFFFPGFSGLPLQQFSFFLAVCVILVETLDFSITQNQLCNYICCL